MGLLKQWRDVAYSQQADKAKLQKFWAEYFVIEKGIYEQLLSNPDEVVRGTVKELADKYKVNVMTMTGFLDGINDSLKVQNPIEEMEEDTEVNLGFDKELLYKNMVDAKADWLYELPMQRVSFSSLLFHLLPLFSSLALSYRFCYMYYIIFFYFGHYNFHINQYIL